MDLESLVVTCLAARGRREGLGDSTVPALQFMNEMRMSMREQAHQKLPAATEDLWRIRGMLLGLKRASISRAIKEEHAYDR